MSDLARPLPPELMQLASARRALEESRDLSEVKKIHDVARAAETYAQAHRLGEEAERYAGEIVTRATRRIGELLDATPPEKGINQNISTGEVPKLTPRQQVGKKLSAASQELAKIDEQEFERELAKTKKPSVSRLLRLRRDRQAEEKRAEVARANPRPPDLNVDLRLGDFRTELWFDNVTESSIDAVITDPPYAREHLPLLGDLAEWADRVLTADGILVVLFGQTWLPEVYAALDGGRPYRWTACYLTPGPGYVSMARHVQSNWKPLLIYGGGARFADVVRSEGVDVAAKDNHPWGQDYGAFSTLVERLTQPGQTVADPFAGSGTTLLAAHHAGRHVLGAEINKEHYERMLGRFGIER